MLLLKKLDHLGASLYLMSLIRRHNLGSFLNSFEISKFQKLIKIKFHLIFVKFHIISLENVFAKKLDGLEAI